MPLDWLPISFAVIIAGGDSIGIASYNLVLKLIYGIISYRSLSYCTYSIASDHILSHCIISYGSVSCRITLYHIVPVCVVSYRIVLYRIVSYPIVSYCIVSHRIVSLTFTEPCSFSSKSGLGPTHLNYFTQSLSK